MSSGLSLGFAFWNLNKKPLAPFIRELADEHNIDIIVLAESQIDIDHLLDKINENQDQIYFLDEFPSGKITLLTRLPHGSIEPISDSLGLSIRHIKPPIGDSFLLVSAHFPSKLYRDEIGHLGYASQVADLIRKAEVSVGHTRTLLVGDLNMNPFEAGVAAANGLHACMSRRIVERGGREVDGIHYPMFYNPMWGRFGDSNPGPPGTFFYGPTGHMSLFWHMFDQVLIRKSLLSSFDDKNLQIISMIGKVSLTDHDETPDTRNSSDHLPIVFRIHLNKDQL